MKAILIMLVVGALLLPACSDKARELYDTAKFEELQSNREHATQLYEEIIRKYPDSEYARKARERLTALKEASRTPVQQEKQR